MFTHEKWIKTASNFETFNMESSNKGGSHGRESRQQNCPCSLGGWGGINLSFLSMSATLANYGHLWVNVCRRGYIALSSKCVMLPCDEAWAVVWKDVKVDFMCLGESMCLLSPPVWKLSSDRRELASERELARPNWRPLPKKRKKTPQ